MMLEYEDLCTKTVKEAWINIRHRAKRTTLPEKVRHRTYFPVVADSSTNFRLMRNTFTPL